MSRRLFFVIFIALLPVFAFGQWQWMQTFGGSGLDNSTGVVAAEGQIFTAGVFSGQSWIGSNLLSSAGEEDVYVAGLDAGGAVSWVLSGGGTLDDEVTAVGTDAQGNVLVAGAYWLNAAFAGVNFTAQQSSRSLFVLHISPGGELNWAKNLHGTAIKKISAIGADAYGNVYLSGYFQGQLSLDEWVLTANGATDLFVTKLDASGGVTWAAHAGQSGDTRITGMAVKPGGGVVVGGYFNGITQIGDYLFTANTYDRDVFLADYDADGFLQWARKAGGVHNDELTGIAIGEGGTVFATGYLVGVMSLGEGIAIQSANGNPDFYLLKYNSDGLPLQARAMGGALRDQSMSIVSSEGTLAITGFFLDAINIDGQQVINAGPAAGFILRFDTTLTLLQAEVIRSGEGPVYPSQIAVDAAGNFLVTGSFEGVLQYGGATTAGAGGADAFTGKWKPLSTATDEPFPAQAHDLAVYPNPASGAFQISTAATLRMVQVFDQQGKMVFTASSDQRLIPAQQWAAGVYRVLVYTTEGRRMETALIIRN